MSGGWARGIVNVKDNSNALQMQIGLHGSGQTLNRMYFGKAYNDFAMEIFPATKRTNFVGVLTKEGKPIATEEYVDANVGGGGTKIVTSATEVLAQATNGTKKYKEGDIMAEISQNVNIEMLEKLPDGTYKRKYPKTRADDGTTFDEHLADNVQHITSTERTNWNAKQSALPIENRRKITFGTTDPSGGVDGDIYFQYE